MKHLLKAAQGFIEENLVCDVCSGAVEFAGTPEIMYLVHQSPKDETHEPEVDTVAIIDLARDALDEGDIDSMNDYIRAHVLLITMSYDTNLAINAYREALQEVSERYLNGD